MNETILRTTLTVALAAGVGVGCKKDEAAPTEPTEPTATDTKTPDTQADPKDEPAAPAETVRPPTAADLADYTKDLEGEGPLVATFKTTLGDIHCELYPDEAPMTVANFVGLARGLKPFINPQNGQTEKRPFYDGIIFHRVIPEFMIQTGDPLGRGTGGPGYTFADEFNDKLVHDQPGTLSMANAGPATNGSQIFLTEKPTPHLDQDRPRRGHTVFGRCKEVDIIEKIARVPKAPGSSSTPAEDVKIEKLEISRGMPQ